MKAKHPSPHLKSYEGIVCDYGFAVFHGRFGEGLTTEQV